MPLRSMQASLLLVNEIPFSILTGMFRDRFDKNMENGTRGCLCLLRNCRVRKTR